MENSVEFMHLADIIDLPQGCSSIISSYVSLIKINGRPIIPPLISDEKRIELNEDKKRAIALERKLSQTKKKKTFDKGHGTSPYSMVVDSTTYRQASPARPVSLSLIPYSPGKALPTAELHSTKNVVTRKNDVQTILGNNSSQKSTKHLGKIFRSTLEQRLANEEDVIVRNKKNDFKQSPIIEENYSPNVDDFAESDDSKRERKRWSPLKVESLNSLKIQLPVKGSDQNGEDEDNLEISFEHLDKTCDSVTPSSSLMRQNSYTLLTPSPALLNYLEAQKEKENTQRSHSGRKTWDLTRAKKNWEPNTGSESLDPEKISDVSERSLMTKHDTSSIDSFSIAQKERMSTPKEPKAFLSKHDSSSLESISLTQKSLSYSHHEGVFPHDGSTSPSSCSSKKVSPKIQKIKCKIKNKKSKSFKNVPSPKATDKVPFKNGSGLTQRAQNASVPLGVGEELSDLSDMLMKMKFEHERQKRELEEKQRVELHQFELLFKTKEAELLRKVGGSARKTQRSIYSQFQNVQGFADRDVRIMGDGSHIMSTGPLSDLGMHPRTYHLTEEYVRRPQSAKDFHPHLYQLESKTNRKTRSMDFSQGNFSQDTDLDVSLQDDSILSKELLRGNDLESDTVSNISSRSSTMSSETRMETMPLLDPKPYELAIPAEELEKYQKAATIITAAAKGFLIRRLLNTAHVQSLITTLRDAISCATQLHSASDLGDSDVDLMRRLGRQIEAAWEAVYNVFFNNPISEKMQLISSDRERLKTLSARSTETQKRLSSATEKSLRRRRSNSLMSKSQTSNGCKPRRSCLKMAASYPSPMSRQKL